MYPPPIFGFKSTRARLNWMAIGVLLAIAAPVHATSDCNSQDTACHQAAIDRLIDDLKAIAVSFEAKGNLHAANRWHGAIEALKGNRDSSFYLVKARAWLNDAEKYRWRNGQTYLPRVIEALTVLENEQATKQAELQPGQPETPQPETPQPETPQPEATQPETPQPEATQPESSHGEEPLPSLPPDAVTVAKVISWRGGNIHSSHYQRWTRVLAALGVENGTTAMTATEAYALAETSPAWAVRWMPTAKTLEVLEALQSIQQQIVLEETETTQPRQDETIDLQQVQNNPVDQPTGPVAIPAQNHKGVFPILTVLPDGNLDIFNDGIILPLLCIDSSKGCTAPEEMSPTGRLRHRSEALIQSPQRASSYQDQYAVYDTPAVGVLDGWTISRFGKDSYEDEITGHDPHWLTVEWKPVGRYNKSMPKAIGWTRQRWVIRDVSEGGSAYLGGAVCPPGTEECWYYEPGTRKQERRIPAFNARGYNTVSTWEIIDFNPKYVPKAGIQRWFVAAKADGNDNYRAFGYWLRYHMAVPAADAEPDEHWVLRPSFVRTNFFAAGNNPADDVSAVSGTAKYYGEAAGTMTWEEADAERWSTFESAPVILTANFDTMWVNGEVNFHDYPYGKEAWHAADGHITRTPKGGVVITNGLDYWRTIAPSAVSFHAEIGNDGVFEVVPPSELWQLAHSPLRHERNGEDYVAPEGIEIISPHLSSVSGQFYQPNDNGAPGSVMGIFTFTGALRDENPGGRILNPSIWRIQGAFGAER